MRSLKLIALSLAATMPLAIHHEAQGGTPKTKPPTTGPSFAPGDCYALASAHVPGVGFKYARIRAGGKWISGCIGPAGECHIPFYVPC